MPVRACAVVLTGSIHIDRCGTPASPRTWGLVNVQTTVEGGHRSHRSHRTHQPDGTDRSRRRPPGRGARPGPGTGHGGERAHPGRRRRAARRRQPRRGGHPRRAAAGAGRQARRGELQRAGHPAGARPRDDRPPGHRAAGRPGGRRPAVPARQRRPVRPGRRRRRRHGPAAGPAASAPARSCCCGSASATCRPGTTARSPSWSAAARWSGSPRRCPGTPARRSRRRSAADEAVAAAARDAGLRRPGRPPRRARRSPCRRPAQGPRAAYAVTLIASTDQRRPPSPPTWTPAPARSWSARTWSTTTGQPARGRSSRPPRRAIPAGADPRVIWCLSPTPGCARAVRDPASGQAWDVDLATGAPTLTSAGNSANNVVIWGGGHAGRAGHAEPDPRLHLPVHRPVAPGPLQPGGVHLRRSATTPTPRSPTCSPCTTGCTTGRTTSGFTESAWNMQVVNLTGDGPRRRRRAGPGAGRRAGRQPQQRQPGHPARRPAADHQHVPVAAGGRRRLPAVRRRRLRHDGDRPRVHPRDHQPDDRRPGHRHRLGAGRRDGRVVGRPVRRRSTCSSTATGRRATRPFVTGGVRHRQHRAGHPQLRHEPQPAQLLRRRLRPGRPAGARRRRDLERDQHAAPRGVRRTGTAPGTPSLQARCADGLVAGRRLPGQPALGRSWSSTRSCCRPAASSACSTCATTCWPPTWSASAGPTRSCCGTRSPSPGMGMDAASGPTDADPTPSFASPYADNATVTLRAARRLGGRADPALRRRLRGAGDAGGRHRPGDRPAGHVPDRARQAVLAGRGRRPASGTASSPLVPARPGPGAAAEPAAQPGLGRRRRDGLRRRGQPRPARSTTPRPPTGRRWTAWPASRSPSTSPATGRSWSARST